MIENTRLPLPYVAIGAALLAFAVAVFAFPIFPDYTQNDEPAHYSLAKSLLDGRGFSVSSYPELSRVPGYPMLLAAIIATLPQWFHGYAAVTVNAVLLLWSTWLWGRKVLPEMLAGTAGERRATSSSDWFILMSIGFPPYWGYVRMLMSEILALWLLSLSVFLWWRAMKSARYTVWAISLGGALGALSLTKPVFILWLPFVATLWVVANKSGRRRSVRVVFLAGIVLLLTVMPWLVRNYAIGGRWSINLVGAAAFLYFGAVPQGQASTEAQFLHYGVAASGHVPAQAALDASDKLMALAKQEISRHPARWLLLRLDAVRKFWFTSNISAFGCDVGRERICELPSMRIAKLLMFIVVAMLWAAAILGGLRLRSWRALSVVWGTALYFTGLGCLGWSGGRYTIPVMPTLLCFSAIGVASMWSTRTRIPFEDARTTT